MTGYEYPNERTLKIIETSTLWETNPKSFLDYIEGSWWDADIGFKTRGKKIITLELHTLGWSGNEEIIRALQKNDFWWMYWQKSIRGGHYWFKIKEIKKT